jgi:uncharacterized membrane protein YjgN (DUF898 family)
MSSVETAVRPEEKTTFRLVFTDRPGLFVLLLKNMGLTIVTLGIYRFWARTALRRYWWSSVVIDGDPLEYTGTGAELFLGFLLFLLVVSPFGLVLGLLKAFAADPKWQILLTLGFYVFLLFILLPVAMFRARRYRMSRTRWRGIRGGMGGSTLRFLAITVGGFAATALSCGILAPWMRISQTRYITNCSSFGDRNLAFDGKSGGLILRWLVVLSLPAFLVFAAGLLFVAVAAPQLAAGAQADFKELGAGGVVAMLPIMLAVPIFGIGLIWYNVYEFRYTLNHTLIGSLRLRSLVEPIAIVGYILAFFFVGGIAISMFLGIAIAVIAGFTVVFTHGNKDLAGGIIVVAIILFYALAIMAMSILRVLILDKAIVKMLVDTAALAGPGGLAGIGQSTVPMPGSGEGMADAFDLGAF